MSAESFPIHPLSRYAGSSAAIRRPKEIAFFSYDDDHRLHLDDRSIRYYYPPRLGVDLTRGFDTFEKLDDTADDHLDSLLKTVARHEEEHGKRFEAHIITWRGMMTKIMAAPFDDMNGFEMNATNFEGTIFLEENHEHKLQQHREQLQQRPQPGGHSQDMMAYWGYKFETLSVLPEPWASTSRDFIESREDMVVNNNAQYCSVVRTGIGSSKLVIGGEVDAIWDRKPRSKDDPINWVELKTSAVIESDRDMFKYERKLMKFWIQSFLLGVPKVVVGFRDLNGILRSVEEIDTARIPNTVRKQSAARGKAPLWDGNTCINFTASFLEWLKQTITSDGVWRLRKVPRAPIIEVFRIEESGHGHILSEDFLASRMRLAAANMS